MRWNTYVADIAVPGPDALQNIARTLAEDGPTLYVFSIGFDPRCMKGLQAFLDLDHVASSSLLRVGLAPGSANPHSVTMKQAQKNRDAFEILTRHRTVECIEFPSIVDSSDVGERMGAGPYLAERVVSNALRKDVSTVVVDISSMPSSIYFPLVAALLSASEPSLSSEESFQGNIFLVTCENPEIDGAISEIGVEEAAYVGGFRQPRRHTSHLDDETEFDKIGKGSATVVWAPVIGERCDSTLRAVEKLLKPDEICPVLPFPARRPRRSDDLLLENRQLLFERFNVSMSDIVFASESNPFDLYRTLRRLDKKYDRALKDLGPVTLTVSTHSSKLLSIGVLLAAYELDLPVAACPVQDYELSLDEPEEELNHLHATDKLSCIWLAGEAYR